MEKIEALIFDMDGLIFDSERVVQRTWNYAGETLGYGKIGEHIYHTLGFNVKRRETYFKSVYGENFRMDEFNAITRKKFYEIVEDEGLPVKTGVRELLTYAKSRGLLLGVATSSRREYSTRNLTEAGLMEYFDGCIFGDLVSQAKPDPEIYLRACEIVGANPGKSMALEDAPSGIRAAHAAGMYPVMVPDMVQPDAEVRGLCYRKVETLLDVIPLLEEFELPDMGS